MDHLTTPLNEFANTQDKFKYHLRQLRVDSHTESNTNKVQKVFAVGSSRTLNKSLDSLAVSDVNEHVNEELAKDIHGELYNPVINILSNLYKNGMSGKLSMPELLNELDKIINSI